LGEKWLVDRVDWSLQTWRSGIIKVSVREMEETLGCIGILDKAERTWVILLLISFGRRH
jgi:hypothetical protein